MSPARLQHIHSTLTHPVKPAEERDQEPCRDKCTSRMIPWRQPRKFFHILVSDTSCSLALVCVLLALLIQQSLRQCWAAARAQARECKGPNRHATRAAKAAASARADCEWWPAHGVLLYQQHWSQHSLANLFLCLQNAEIFTLTYGSIVRQLIADFEDLDEVNKQLEKM